ADWFAAGHAEVSPDLSGALRIALSVGAHEAPQLPLIERPGCARMKSLEEEALGKGPEAAKQRELREHGAVAARKVRNQLRMKERFTANDAEHVTTPAGPREHLPEAFDGVWAVADRRAIGPLSNARLRIHVGLGAGVEAKELTIIADEGRGAVRQDGSRI